MHRDGTPAQNWLRSVVSHRGVGGPLSSAGSGAPAPRRDPCMSPLGLCLRGVVGATAFFNGFPGRVWCLHHEPLTCSRDWINWGQALIEESLGTRERVRASVRPRGEREIALGMFGGQYGWRGVGGRSRNSRWAQEVDRGQRASWTRLAWHLPKGGRTAGLGMGLELTG